MDISELQKIAKKFRDGLNRQNPKQYNTPVELLADLTEELGELAKSITRKEIRNMGSEHKIEEEVIDVLFSLLWIANHYGLDIEKEIKKSVQKWEKRFGVELG